MLSVREKQILAQPMKRHLATLAIAGLLVADLHSQELNTGPAAGTALTPVKAYGVGGPHPGAFAGKEFDVAGEIGDGPGAILFMHELTRNILPVVRGLDQFGAEYSLKGFKTFVLMLSPDRTAAESRLKAVNGSLKLRNPVVLSLDGAEGPGNYALNRKATLSLVLVDKGKVVRTHAYTDVNAEDEGILRGWVEEIVGSIPENLGEYRQLAKANLPKEAGALRSLAVEQAVEIKRLQAQVKRLKEQQGGRYGGMRPDRRNMQRGAQPQMRREGAAREGEAKRPDSRRGEGAPKRSEGRGGEGSRRGGERDMKKESGGDAKPQRQGRPPEDPQLNSLLRSFIRQTNDDARADEVFAQIAARAKESDALRAEAVEMFKLMLSFRDRYGTKHAQELAEGFLKENAKPAKRGR